MKTIIFISILLLTSCKDEIQREVLFSYDNSNPKIIAEFTRHQQKNNIYKRIQYHPTGVISGEGLMINDKRNGIWRYYDESGNKIAENILLDDVEIDSIKCWYSSGEISRKIIDLNDEKKRWLVTDYYKNEQLKNLTFLVNKEIPDSLFIEYHLNGTIKKEGKLDEGKKIGEWVEYDTLGVEIKRIEENGINYLTF